MSLTFSGLHAEFKADWKTPEILLEGSLGCGKSTVALDKEIDAILKYPGIPILIARWTEEAVSTKLKKAFEEILAIRNMTAEWDAKEKLYRFENGSIVHMFGLKAVSAIERFSKIRSLGVCRILVDQAEEMDRSVADELRARLRPDLTATVTGRKFPFQLTFVSNPSDDNFWLSRQFPKDDRIKGRRLFSLSVFDNPYLPQETIDGLLRTYPVEHPKHQTMVLGKRGLNITGDAIYEGIYNRAIHVRSCQLLDTPLLEGLHCGTHNPSWIIAQRTRQGGLRLLGGVMGRQMMLEDFLPIVKTYRNEWFGQLPMRLATSPMGETLHSIGSRVTMLQLLREAKMSPQWRENANAPDVQLAMIENISSLCRRRLMHGEEAFGIDNNAEHWLEASADEGIKPQPFITFAFEGGYVWDEHTVSVSNKSVRQPKDDDWYFNAMRCVENIMLNFCVGQKTSEELAIQKRDRMIEQRTKVLTGPQSWLQ